MKAALRVSKNDLSVFQIASLISPDPPVSIDRSNRTPPDVLRSLMSAEDLLCMHMSEDSRTYERSLAMQSLTCDCLAKYEAYIGMVLEAAG